AAYEWETLRRQVLDIGREINTTCEPRLDVVGIGGGHLHGAVLEQRADMCGHDLLLQPACLSGRAHEPPGNQSRECAAGSERGDLARNIVQSAPLALACAPEAPFDAQ